MDFARTRRGGLGPGASRARRAASAARRGDGIVGAM